MENKQSSLFPWSKPFGYNKLSSSSSSSSLPENQQLLLDNHCDHYYKGWTLDTETKSKGEDTANLQRRIVALEKENIQLRDAMDTRILELKSRLDSSPTTQLPLLDLIESKPDMGPIQDQVNQLQTAVNELKFNTLMNHNGQELERIIEKNNFELERITEKNRELEKKLTELTLSIANLKLHQENRRPSSKENEEDERGEMLQQKSGAIPESMESYFVILIFLISILIGTTI